MRLPEFVRSAPEPHLGWIIGVDIEGNVRHNLQERTGRYAVITSVNAVLRNKPAMVVWAGIIVLGLLIGFATAFVGLAVVIPVIGYATWHGYRDTIDASAWPRHPAPDAAVTD